MKAHPIPSVDTDTVLGNVSLTIDEARERIQHMAQMMDPAQRQSVAKEIHSGLSKLQRHHEMSRDQVQRQVEAYQSILDWEGLPMVLEKNDCSRLHRLKEAAAAGMLLTPDGKLEPQDRADSVSAIQQTFVVRHNWAKAFEGAEGIETDFCLPYQCCSFEFRLSGRNLIVIAVDCSLGRMSGAFIEAGDYWIRVESGCADKTASNFGQMLWAQVRAICVALDADVATSEVVRAPTKLNEKRARSGKAPLPDYRVVDLARRHRLANPAAAGAGTGTGTKKRLHFRRGHWRHFETSKTWVKWCLVGDPDLGFINKHYRL